MHNWRDRQGTNPKAGFRTSWLPAISMSMSRHQHRHHEAITKKILHGKGNMSR